jgi:hypothetical protein
MAKEKQAKELRPCPFCAKEMAILRDESDDYIGLVCNNVLCPIGGIEINAEPEHWNHRPTEDDLRGALEKIRLLVSAISGASPGDEDYLSDITDIIIKTQALDKAKK